MRRRLKRIAGIAGVTCALFLMWVFRPYARPDASLVDPSLDGLREPFKEVLIAYYLDGGSYGIRLVDQAGKTLDLCVPAPLGEEGDQYQRVFVGALHYTEEGSREVTKPHHTKLRLADILRSHPGLDRDRDVALASISGRWRDFWRVIRRIYLFKSYERQKPA